MQAVRKRILYIDDDKDACEVITILLEMSGYEVISAQKYADGLEKAKSDGFDMFMLDSWLPDGSGVELCRQILSFKPLTPVVFYSGAARDDDKREAIMAGAREYLIKPADFKLVEQTVSRLLGDGDGASGGESKTASRDGESKAAIDKNLRVIKEEGRLRAERTRAVIERSRQLAKETKERIERSSLKRDI